MRGVCGFKFLTNQSRFSALNFVLNPKTEVKNIDVKSIATIAENVANQLGIRLSDKTAICTNMRNAIPVTNIFYNNHYMMWIDRHYIAISKRIGLGVLYIYITHVHVMEELPLVVKMHNKLKSLSDYIMYSNIIEQLRMAQFAMNDSDSKYYLLDNYSEHIRRCLQ